MREARRSDTQLMEHSGFRSFIGPRTKGRNLTERKTSLMYAQQNTEHISFGGFPQIL